MASNYQTEASNIDEKQQKNREDSSYSPGEITDPITTTFNYLNHFVRLVKANPRDYCSCCRTGLPCTTNHFKRFLLWIYLTDRFCHLKFALSLQVDWSGISAEEAISRFTDRLRDLISSCTARNPAWHTNFENISNRLRSAMERDDVLTYARIWRFFISLVRLVDAIHIALNNEMPLDTVLALPSKNQFFHIEIYDAGVPIRSLPRDKRECDICYSRFWVNDRFEMDTLELLDALPFSRLRLPFDPDAWHRPIRLRCGHVFGRGCIVEAATAQPALCVKCPYRCCLLFKPRCKFMTFLRDQGIEKGYIDAAYGLKYGLD